MDTQPFRFGILGTGNIAGQFAGDVTEANLCRVVAVGSRSAESAAAFGEKFGLESAHCHDSYDALISDVDIDAVYVSLPNHLHAEWTIKAMEAGKHVLCEKPFAMDAAEAQRMFDAAERSGKRVMEAFMYRCHPLMAAVRQQVLDGAIGGLRMLRASFCYRTTNIDGNVRFDPDLGGGALMDIGSYCLNFARFIVGREPSAAHIVGHQHTKRVDDFAAAILMFDPDPSTDGPTSGAVTAALTFGMTVQLDNTAHLGGTDGHLQIPIPWKPPVRGAQHILSGQTPPKQDRSVNEVGPPAPRVFSVDAPAPLYADQADQFAAAVRSGTSLPITPQDTLGNMRLIDTLRQQLEVGAESRS